MVRLRSEDHEAPTLLIATSDTDLVRKFELAAGFAGICNKGGDHACAVSRLVCRCAVQYLLRLR